MRNPTRRKRSNRGAVPVLDPREPVVEKIYVRVSAGVNMGKFRFEPFFYVAGQGGAVRSGRSKWVETPITAIRRTAPFLEAMFQWSESDHHI